MAQTPTELTLANLAGAPGHEKHLTTVPVCPFTLEQRVQRVTDAEIVTAGTLGTVKKIEEPEPGKWRIGVEWAARVDGMTNRLDHYGPEHLASIVAVEPRTFTPGVWVCHVNKPGHGLMKVVLSTPGLTRTDDHHGRPAGMWTNSNLVQVPQVAAQLWLDQEAAGKEYRKQIENLTGRLDAMTSKWEGLGKVTRDQADKVAELTRALDASKRKASELQTVLEDVERRRRLHRQAVSRLGNKYRQMVTERDEWQFKALDTSEALGAAQAAEKEHLAVMADLKHQLDNVLEFFPAFKCDNLPELERSLRSEDGFARSFGTTCYSVVSAVKDRLAKMKAEKSDLEQRLGSYKAQAESLDAELAAMKASPATRLRVDLEIHTRIINDTAPVAP